METEHREPVDNAFGWIERVARAAQNPARGWRRWLRWARWVLAVVAIGYVGGLLLGLGVAQWVGERHWVSSLVLLLPPALWLIPVAVLGPVSAVIWPRLCLLLAVAPVYVFVGFMPFHWSRPLEAGEGGTTITVLANNAGQRQTRTLFGLVEEVRPDLMVLQDVSARRGAVLAHRQGDPGMDVVQHAHFVLVSRYPIRDSGLVEGLVFRGTPAAAWFELEVGGQPVMVYNVHLPTPRHDLERLRGQGFLYELSRLGGIYSREGRGRYREALAERVEVAERLGEIIAAEGRPVIAAGDFNATANGYVRRLFAATLTDAFAERGRGYGLTFPSVTRNPLSLFGPWMRIDYLFTSDDFRVLDAEVEGRERAQHRAVIARLEFIAADD